MENKLKNFAEGLFAKHGTRMSRKEKDAFLEHCKQEFAKLGYDDIIIKEDKNMFGMTSKNLVVGPLDATNLVTAHYDTPGRNGFLLFLSPLIGSLWANIVFMLIIMLISMLPNTALAYYIPWIRYVSLAFFLIIIASSFIKNKHNHNDNTSGVLGVYRIAELVSQNQKLKPHCAFILFDHEEVFPGLLGSKAFSKWRNKNHPDKVEGTVINLDCIGVGDILSVMTKKKNEEFYNIVNFMESQGFNVERARGGLAGNSDHASFTNGVSLLYKKRSLLGPTYIPNIHTSRDKVCNLDQIEAVCKSAYKYIDMSYL